MVSYSRAIIITATTIPTLTSSLHLIKISRHVTITHQPRMISSRLLLSSSSPLISSTTNNNFLLPQQQQQQQRRRRRNYFQTFVHNNHHQSSSSLPLSSSTNSSESKDDSSSSSSFPTHLNREWSLSHDKTLHANRHLPLPRLASLLGRGLGGVESRLAKLSDVNSPAYARLFADSSSKDDDDEEEATNKKMTPVGEVLRRIRWDDSLPSSEFTVRYYDRVAEKSMDVPFDRENESVTGSERLFVFAIPEHRISGIFYKERAVWDKEARWDGVFGSGAGEGTTIDVVMETYEEWMAEREREREEERRRRGWVTERMEGLLGGENMGVLKEASVDLRRRSGGEGEMMGGGGVTDRDIEGYVRLSLGLFRETMGSRRQSSKWIRDDDDDDDDDDDGTNITTELDYLEPFSELVALLPDETLRERILTAIQSTSDRLSNKNNKNNKQQKKRQPPPLLTINESDLIETYARGSGPGGQKINKTNNKVVLLHVPTNIRVECQETRSLQQNRKIARKRLRLKLDELVNGAASRKGRAAATVAKRKSRTKSRNKARLKKKLREKEEEKMVKVVEEEEDF